jgi:hypothetical protein
MCCTEFVALLLDGSEAGLMVVEAEAELEGAVTCPTSPARKCSSFPSSRFFGAARISTGERHEVSKSGVSGAPDPLAQAKSA